MKNFLKKKLNKKGFTLAELLIVVAIIGVLVAVSIPIFSTQLEKSRENTDIANLRAAKAAAIALYLDCNEAAGTYWYDADMGALVVTQEDKNNMYNGGEYCRAEVMDQIAVYGKGNTKAGGCENFKMSTDSTDNLYYTTTSDVRHAAIKVVISSNDGTSTASSGGEGVKDTVTLMWFRAFSAGSGATSSHDNIYKISSLGTSCEMQTIGTAKSK